MGPLLFSIYTKSLRTFLQLHGTTGVLKPLDTSSRPYPFICKSVFQNGSQHVFISTELLDLLVCITEMMEFDPESIMQ